MSKVYRTVLFAQGEDADEVISDFQTARGWDFIDTYTDGATFGPPLTVQPWASTDEVWHIKADEEWFVVSVNWGLNTIAVTRVEEA